MSKTKKQNKPRRQDEMITERKARMEALFLCATAIREAFNKGNMYCGNVKESDQVYIKREIQQIINSLDGEGIRLWKQ